MPEILQLGHSRYVLLLMFTSYMTLTNLIASAVPGAVKAEPFIHNNPWWTNPGPVVCEMDAMQNGSTAPAVPAAA
jgi:hypothetical protein